VLNPKQFDIVEIDSNGKTASIEEKRANQDLILLYK
jgi:dTDP-glucose pyrophosphorylase